MRIVITGASGFVGQNIVPRLIERGHSLLLVGRDTALLLSRFQDVEVCDYDEMAVRTKDAEVLLHLATVNTDSDAPEALFFDVNVAFLVNVARKAIDANIGTFINVSSVHALDEGNSSAYARSKRSGISALKKCQQLRLRTLYLPLVYGDEWAGKLSFLNYLPKWFACILFKPLDALKATCHVDQLVSYIENIPNEPETILASDKSKNWIFVGMKRLLDLLFAVGVIVFLGWALVILWTLVRLESKGPGIFKQTRVGRNKILFTCYKFRTMHVGTKQAGTHEVSAASVTRIGHFMRKTKLDELPQVVNILLNQVSLIGPRPCLPSQFELIEARSKNGVYSLTPGISGLAQVNDIDMSDPQRLAQWDRKYLDLRGLILDMKITLATVVGNGQGDNTAPR